MNKFITGFLLTSTLAASLVMAQTTTTRTPPTPAEIAARRVAMLTKFLTLTADQQTKATTIYTASAIADATARDGQRTAHTQLSDAIKSNNPTAIQQAATTIGTLTTNQIATDAKADASFYQLLTADQKAKYDQMHSHGFGGPGGFGRGGAMMGGPGMSGRFRGGHRGGDQTQQQ